MLIRDLVKITKVEQKFIILFYTCIVLVFTSHIATAGEPSTNAIKIINLMEDLYRGNASLAQMKMTVKTPHYERTMKMSSENLGTEKSMIRILSPKKDRGISTLKLTEEMWNFFPKINKVIKVPPSMMMGAWMGSDFTNDDLVKQTTLTDEYDLELITSADTFRVILLPKAQTVTVWGKIDYLIDRKLMLPVEQNYYDDGGEKVRTLQFSEIKDFDGRKIPSKLTMVPHNKPGNSTTVEYETLAFDPAEVVEANFSLRKLKRRF